MGVGEAREEGLRQGVSKKNEAKQEKSDTKRNSHFQR